MIPKMAIFTLKGRERGKIAVWADRVFVGEQNYEVRIFENDTEPDGDFWLISGTFDAAVKKLEDARNGGTKCRTC